MAAILKNLHDVITRHESPDYDEIWHAEAKSHAKDYT